MKGSTSQAVAESACYSIGPDGLDEPKLKHEPRICGVKGMKKHIFFSAVAILTAATVFCGSAVGQAPAAASPAGLALESIFNPQRAPAQKTMGLLQRSFL